MAVACYTKYLPDKVSSTFNSSMESMKKVVDKTRRRTRVTAVMGLRIFVRSSPGHLFMRGLNTSIDIAEATLDYIAPEPAQRPDQGSDTDPVGDPAASTDETRTNTASQTIISKPLNLAQTLAAYPLARFIRLLRFLKVRLEKIGREKKSSRKDKKILKRRVLSPKKRLGSPSLVNKVLNRILQMVGVKAGPLVMSALSPSKINAEDNVNEKHEKRKHDDVSDSNSDSGAVIFGDLDDYDSEEDPDFMPGSELSHSTDSMEYQEGDTESEAEDKLNEDGAVDGAGDASTVIKEKQIIAEKVELPKVEIGIKCANLLDKDITSKSDPTAVLFLQGKSSDEWFEVGRTENVKNNLSPQFAKKFVLEYDAKTTQRVKLEVYDIDNTTVGLKDDDFLGGIETTLKQIVSNSPYTTSLLKNKKPAGKGTITVSANPVKDAKKVTASPSTGAQKVSGSPSKASQKAAGSPSKASQKTSANPVKEAQKTSATVKEAQKSTGTSQ